jgi:hypothetical protein
MRHHSSTSISKRVAALCFLAGIVASLIGLELLLHLLPTSQGLRMAEVSRESPIARGTPGLRFVKSTGWEFFNPITGHLNNYGFNSEVDYHNIRPVIAVVGDSFVEAMSVPISAAYQSQLQRFLCDQNVYGFALAGGSFADFVEYLHWADHEFRIDGAIILINETKMREKRGPQPGHSYYKKMTDGTFKRALVGRGGPNLLRDTANASMLFRYLFDNLHFNPKVMFSHASLTGEKHNSDRKASVTSLADDGETEEVSRTFLHDLSGASHLRANQITILMDAHRDEIYRGRRPARTALEEQFMRDARAEGYRVIDLSDAFELDYREHHLRLDYSPIDRHWNARGHRLAAEATIAGWKGAVEVPAVCTTAP